MWKRFKFKIFLHFNFEKKYGNESSVLKLRRWRVNWGKDFAFRKKDFSTQLYPDPKAWHVQSYKLLTEANEQLDGQSKQWRQRTFLEAKDGKSNILKWDVRHSNRNPFRSRFYKLASAVRVEFLRPFKISFFAAVAKSSEKPSCATKWKRSERG